MGWLEVWILIALVVGAAPLIRYAKQGGLGRPLRFLPEFTEVPAGLRPTDDPQQIAKIEAWAPTPRGPHADYFVGDWDDMKVGLRLQQENIEIIPRYENDEDEFFARWEPQKRDYVGRTSLWLAVALSDLSPRATTRVHRDRNLQIDGDSALATGLLTSTLAEQIEAGDQLFIDHRQLGYLSERAWDDGQLVPRLWALTEAASRLQSCVYDGSIDSKTLLSQVFSSDKESGTRVRAFKELWKLLHVHNPELRTPEESHAVMNLVQLALHEQHPEVRLVAAIAIQNVEVARRLAADNSVAEGIRARALSMVLDEPSPERLRDEVHGLLAGDLDDVMLSAVFAVIRERELKQALLWLKPPEPSLRADAANNLLTLIRKWPGVERHDLLKGLALNDSQQVAADAIGVLADTADGTWIPWLKALAKQRGVLKHSVELAIAEINDRHAPKTGGLSVVEPAKAGQLAITDATSGSVSELEDKVS